MGILSMFVEVDDTKKVVKPQKVVETPAHPAIISMSDSYTTAGMVNSPEFNTYLEQFEKILADENKRNFPGNDWFEFNMMKNAMSAIPQEGIKYQAAFAGWMTGGNQTKKSLVDTAHMYLGLIDKEISDFQQAYTAQYDSQVGKNELLIQQKTAKVQELTAQIAQLNEEINALRGANQAATSTLTAKRDAFNAAGQYKRQIMLEEINKINQYIS